MLDRATLNRRLLLVLFALGTNMGIRQMAVTGEHGVGEAELRHVRATFVTRENRGRRSPRWSTPPLRPATPLVGRGDQHRVGLQAVRLLGSVHYSLR